MAELSTVARPYAEALFAVAKQDKAGLSAWAEQVQQLADIAAIEDVRVAMADPRLEDAQRTSIFLGLVKPEASAAMQSFVTLLVANDRLTLLPFVAEQFHALKDEAEGDRIKKRRTIRKIREEGENKEGGREKGK